MPRFRKKPVVIDAMLWNPADAEARRDLVHWLASNGCFARSSGNGATGFTTLAIPTLEGWITASPGDWVIRGVKGEFYPCKPDIFDATYEPVEGPPLTAPGLDRHKHGFVP